MKLCRCGRSIYGMGLRCQPCQAEFRADRAASPRKTTDPVREAPDGRSPAHLAWVRTLPCSVAGCPEKSEAAHVRINSGGGIGLKPSDEWAVSLCRNHHREQHQIGHAAFDAKYDLNLRALAEQLAAKSPHLNKGV